MVSTALKNLENEASESSYPTNLVGWGYSLMGGAIGGAIAGVFFIFDTQNIEVLIFIIIMSIIFGAVLGLIPSIITGVWIANNKTTIKSIEDYCKVFLMGFLVSSVYGLLATIVSQYVFDWRITNNFSQYLFRYLLPITGGMGLLGGLSSMILGKMILPKVQAQNNLFK